MRLYHTPQTRSTRILWALEEVGAPYDVTLVSREEKSGEEHRARHPLGRSPVVHDGEGYVFESAAICFQLADLHPEAGLIPPTGSHERALVYQWAFFAMTEVEPHFVEIAFRDSSDDAKAKATASLGAALAVVQDALGGDEYLVGGRFGVADLVLGAVLASANNFSLLDGFPGLVAYVGRLNERDARKRALAA